MEDLVYVSTATLNWMRCGVKMVVEKKQGDDIRVMTVMVIMRMMMMVMMKGS